MKRRRNYCTRLRGVPFDSYGGGGGPGLDPGVFFSFQLGVEYFFFAESGVLIFFEVNYMYILKDAIHYY